MHGFSSVEIPGMHPNRSSGKKRLEYSTHAPHHVPACLCALHMQVVGTWKLCIASLVGAQRTVQNNGNVKSGPNAWACEDSNTFFFNF